MKFAGFGKIVAGVIGVALVIWIGRMVTTPPPGEKKPDQGREHVSEADVAKFAYNSNPPTSGPHLISWVKPGVYTTVQSEGELIHSLEHGYITIHYNCNAPPGQSFKGQASVSAELSGPQATSSVVNDTDDCKKLINDLATIARKKKLFKLLVVPRPQLARVIGLAAWTYIDTFDAYDEKRIVRFIDYHRDHGLEQTME